ncbi:MAG TPA: DUF4293 family protein [Flavobacteriia bacterium]|jgi:hypothetical protein|nr:DUF4293 family protein [Flavobacteriia bacterium]
MIQRIQSLYLLIGAVISLGLTFVFSVWTTVANSVYYIMDLLTQDAITIKMIPILFIISGVMSLISIFLFKNRKNQFIVNRLNILINLILLGILIYHLLTLSGEMQVSEKGIGAVLPIVVIVLLVLANKAIKKDEDLVKSVDRLR